LIDQAEIREVHAPGGLDVVNRTTGTSGLEEDAVTVAAQRKDAGHVIRDLVTGHEPRFDPKRNYVSRNGGFDRCHARFLDWYRPAGGAAHATVATRVANMKVEPEKSHAQHGTLSAA
jgi:hypothetical protein